MTKTDRSTVTTLAQRVLISIQGKNKLKTTPFITDLRADFCTVTPKTVQICAHLDLDSIRFLETFA